MKRKRIFLTLLALLLSTAALLSGVACTAPEVPPEEPTVIESSDFLPAPDEIVVWWSGNTRSITLSEDQKNEIYGLFEQIMQHTTVCEHNILDSTGGNGWKVEFIYNERYKYIAPTDGSGDVQDSFEYEKILITNLYCDSERAYCLGIHPDREEGENPMFFHYQFSSENKEFATEWYEILSQYICETVVGGHPEVNPEPMETEKFLEQPDTMRLIHKEQVKNLTVEQQEQVYAAFEEMMDALFFISMERIHFSSGEVIGWFRSEDKICLEFCYDQRRKYVGETIKPSDDEASLVIGEFEFDGILFMVGDGCPAVVVRKGDRYYGMSNSRYVYWFWADFVTFINIIEELSI